MSSLIAKITILITILLISSCNMTPVKKDVKLNYKVPDNFNNSNNNNKKIVIKDKWWKKFKNENLQIVIEKALKNNLDLKLALTNIKNLETQFTLSKASKYPMINASGGINVARVPKPKISVDTSGGNFKTTTTYEPNTNTSYTLQLGLRYELDIFGKYSSLERAAIYNLKASESNYIKVTNMIITQVIKLFYDIKATQKNIIITQKLIEISQEELELQEKRYVLGVGRVFNVEILKQSIEATKSGLEGLNQLLKIKKQMLTTLLGEYPNDNIITDNKIFLPKLENVEIGIPSELLKRRPDIISAEMQMDAAREQIGYAKADRFPSISLSAALGFINILDFANFFKSDFITVSGGANVNQTILDAGVKSVKLKQAKIRYTQAVLNYKKIILNAFNEVETSLIKIDSIKKQKVFLNNSLEAAKRSYDDAQKRYINGIGYFKTINDLRKSIFSTENNIVNLDKALIFAYIELYVALGL